MFKGKCFWLFLLLNAAGIFVLAGCAGGEEAPEMATITTEPPATAQPAAGGLTPGVQQIAFTLMEDVEEIEKAGIFLIGVDGSGPSKLVEGEHTFLRCQSPDGSGIVYQSDEEIPNEPFLYVANADGSDPQKATEEKGSVWCLSQGSFIRSVGLAQFTTDIVLYDPETGQETTLLTDANLQGARPFIHPDPQGRRIAFLSGNKLELVDVETGERRRLGDPLAAGSRCDLAWSPDGRRLAYLVGFSGCGTLGPTTGDYELHVMDVSTKETRLVYRLEDARLNPAETFSFSLSPSGNWLLASVPFEDCFSDPEPFPPELAQQYPVCELVLVNVESGEARQVAKAPKVYFAEWAPNEDTFAYATNEAAYLESVNGEVRELASATEDDCPICLNSFGWSADGLYIGLFRVTSYSPSLQPLIAVLDTTTGEVQTIFEKQGDFVFIWSPSWR